MGFLWALIVGGIIGWLASLILGKDVPGGIIGNIIAGFAVIPAILGAVILIFIVSLILRAVRK